MSLGNSVDTLWRSGAGAYLKDPTGRVANQLLYRHDEPKLEVVVDCGPLFVDSPVTESWSNPRSVDS
jgi:hypothetical protein